MFLAQNEVLGVHTHVQVSMVWHGSCGEVKSPGNTDTLYMNIKGRTQLLEAMPTWAETCLGINSHCSLI